MKMPPLRAYTPFLAIVAVQALIVAFVPSTPDDVTQTFASGGSPAVVAGEPSGGGLGDPATVGRRAETDAGPGGGTPGVQGTPGSPGASGGSGPSAIGGSGAGGGTETGDVSHCTEDGRQFALLYHAPPCAPAWPADGENGGATAQGVTGDSVRVTLVLRKPNPTADPIMASQGLGITAEEANAQAQAAAEFINSNYELYGRALDIRVLESSCDIAPTDVPCYRELARTAARDSFIVILVAFEPPEFFEEVARNGAIALGGLHYSEAAGFAPLAPYRYDVLPNGTLVARFLAEYYCTKLHGSPATHSGSVIHPTVGRRGAVDRRAGIITVDRPPLVAAARELQTLLAECSGESPPIVTGSPDAATAQQQVDAAMANLISSKVTTIIPLLDPVALSILTHAATRQTYFPEWIVTGENFIGVDAFARLEDPQQWRHAFGLDFEPGAQPADEMDSTRVWRATGRSGFGGRAPFYAELFWRYFQLGGTMVHLAGPELNAQTVENALMGGGYRRGGWAETGGRPEIPLWHFGPTGHTAFADVREVYWDPNRPSALDGKRGSYAPVHDGRRFVLGELPAGLEGVPVGS